MLSIASLAWNDSKGRTALSEHLPEVVSQFLWLLVSSKMTSAVMLRFEDKIRTLEPSGKVG